MKRRQSSHTIDTVVQPHMEADEDYPSDETSSEFYLNLSSLSPSATSTSYDLHSDSSAQMTPVRHPSENLDPFFIPHATGRKSRLDHHINRSKPKEVLRRVETPEVRVSKYVSVDTREEGILLYTKNATEDEMAMENTKLECPSLLVLPPPKLVPLTQTHTRKKTASKPQIKTNRRPSYEHQLIFESEADRNLTESTNYEKKVSVYRNENYNPSSSDLDSYRLELPSPPHQGSSDEFESGCNTPPYTKTRFPANSNETRIGFPDAYYGSDEANAISGSSLTSGLMLLPEMQMSRTSVTTQGNIEYGDPMRKFGSTDVNGDMMVEESWHEFNPPLRLPQESSSCLTSEISEGQTTVKKFPAEARYLRHKRNNWVGKAKHNKNARTNDATSYDGMITATVAPTTMDRLTSSAAYCCTSPRTKYSNLIKNNKKHGPISRKRSSRWYKFEHPHKSSSIGLHRCQYTNDPYAHYKIGNRMYSNVNAQGDEDNSKLRYTLEWVNFTNGIPNEDKLLPLNLVSSSDITENTLPRPTNKNNEQKVKKNKVAKVRKVKNGRESDKKTTERSSNLNERNSGLSLDELLKKCYEHTDKLDSIIKLLDIGSDSTDSCNEQIPQGQNYSRAHNYKTGISKRPHEVTINEKCDVQTQTVAIPYINTHMNCRCMQHLYYETQTESSDTTIKWVDEEMARIEQRYKLDIVEKTVQNAPMNSENNFTIAEDNDGYHTPESLSVRNQSLGYDLWELKGDIDKLKEEAKKIQTCTANLINGICPGSGAQGANHVADSKIQDHCSLHQEDRFEDSCELVEPPNINISMTDIDEEILKLIDANSESDDYDEYQREIKIKVHRKLKMVEQSITEARGMKHHGCRYKKSMTIASKQMEPDKDLPLAAQNTSKYEFARMARTELELNRKMYELKLRQNEETINQHIEMANLIFEQLERSKQLSTGIESVNQK